MGTSADELRMDIERTRGELGETLDAIGDRVSPGRMIERRKNRMSYGLQSLRDRVMGTTYDARHAVEERVHAVGEAPDAVRRQTQGAPVMAGALAFGVGFLVAAAFPPSATERQAGATLLDKVEPLKDELASTGKELAEHLKEPAREAANEVKDAAKQSAQAVTDTAKSAAPEATGSANYQA